MLVIALQDAGLRVQRQVTFPVEFRGRIIKYGFRVDLVVEDQLFVELKSTERPAPVHEQQLLTYLRLALRPVGLLINFGFPRAVDGIKRLVNGYVPPP
jgi:GxxExxY protein